MLLKLSIKKMPASQTIFFCVVEPSFSRIPSHLHMTNKYLIVLANIYAMSYLFCIIIVLKNMLSHSIA